MAEAALKDVAKGIRETNRSSVGFRQAAVEGNKNMSKISKDLYSLFNVQRKENSGLINAVNESAVEAQATGAKVTQSNVLLQESLGIQQGMLSELKNITIAMKSSNDMLRILAGVTVAGADPTKLGGSAAGSFLASSAAKLGLTGLGIGAVNSGLDAHNSSRDRTPNTNFKAEDGPAKKSAEKYLGREMTATEWSELVRATAAEAGANQTETAMVMASILNRSRDKNKSISEVLREPQQFTAVTGNGGQGVAAFANGPNKNRAESIYGAATNILEKVDKSQKNFQAADPRAYDANGDGGRGAQKIQEKLDSGYSRVGASLFNTKAPDVASGASSTAGGGLPSGDIVALGKALQAQGIRVSEHPEFGGVNPVHKGAAHGQGRALDLNIGRGNVEASDPVMGERFDKLAEQLKAAGYKVIWRSAGHDNHIHVESGGGGNTEPPAAVSNQGDAPKPQKTDGGTVGAPQGLAPMKLDKPAPVDVPFKSLFGIPLKQSTGIAPIPAPMPEIKNSVTEKKVMETKAIQSVASDEKVAEAKAQESASKKEESQTTPSQSGGTTPNQSKSTKEYNGPNDVSIRGDGWSKELLTYFGVIGSSY